MTPSEPTPSKPAKSKVGVIVLAVVLGVVALAGGAIAFLGLIVGRSAEVEPGGMDRVVSAGHFRDYFGLEYEVYPQGESLTRTRYIDGSYDLDYEYTAPGDEFYLSTSISHSRTASDARSVYTGITVSLNVAFRAFGDGVETESAPGLVSSGDQHESGWLVYEGRRTGAYVVVREDEDVMTFIMSGWELEDADVQGVLAGALERL